MVGSIITVSFFYLLRKGIQVYLIPHKDGNNYHLDLPLISWYPQYHGKKIREVKMIREGEWNA